MFQNKKGFTLIELMVVIAIIAILATVVLVALQGARDAAQDAKRKSSTSQVRSVAEVHYAINSQSYANLGTNEEIIQLKGAHGVGDGNLQAYPSADGREYCAVIELVGHSATNHHTFCVSNDEAPGEKTAVGTGNEVCSATNIACNND